MRIRDAVEADAGRLAAIADTPTDVMRNLVHDRTVRVAEAAPGASDPNADTPATGPDGRPSGTEDVDVLGFVSFDARKGTVHVTQVDGTRKACERLLAEPVRFARGESMTVEVLVPTDDDDVRDAAEAVGFHPTGDGPRFDGTPTTRYRLDPAT
jgi:hypothetical protein